MPNILVSGTPGVGKSTLCRMLAERCGMKHLDISALVKERELHDGHDPEYDSFIFNEDKVEFRPS